MRDNRLRDKVRFSKSLVSRGRSQDDVNTMEGDISSGIDDVRRRLDEAQQALGQGAPGDKKDQALDRARRLARNLDSLQERTKERAQAGQGRRVSTAVQGQQARNNQGQGQGRARAGQGPG